MRGTRGSCEGQSPWPCSVHVPQVLLTLTPHPRNRGTLETGHWKMVDGMYVWTGVGRTLWAVSGRPQSPDFAQTGVAEAHLGNGKQEEL